MSAAPTTVFSAPRPRLLGGLSIPVMVIYVVLAFMVCLPLGVGAALLVQTPTMTQYNPPRRQPRAAARPSPTYTTRANGDVEELRRDYDTTVPALVATVDRMQAQADRDATQLDDLRIEMKVTQASVSRLESYATYMMAALSAVVIGMILQIWQQMSAKRQQAS